MRKTTRHRAAIAATVLLCGVLVIALGPRVRVEASWIEPDLPDDIADLDGWLAEEEAEVPALRANDARGIVWADRDRPARTTVSIVYLHGFSADRHEIEPVVTDLGRRIGANVYFSRLRGHGRDGSAMAEASVEAWLADATEALAIGDRIGERVVVIGTSTGGTLATWLAMRPEARGRLDALVLLSPNFQPKDRSSRILLYPWGGTIARLLVGPERCFTPENERQARHWTPCYPTGVLSTMMALVELVRTGDLSVIDAPTLLLYSPDDQVVDPSESLRVATDMTGSDVRIHIVTSGSDSQHHVLAGDILSPESNTEVSDAVLAFLTDSGVVTP